jgi:Zn-dependent metalloprotease
MSTIPHSFCGGVPPHILKRVAEGTAGDSGHDARSTLEQMRELETGRDRTLLDRPAAVPPESVQPRKRRHVYDAQHRYRLRGKLVMSDRAAHRTSGNLDVEVIEAWNGSGAMHDFLAEVFGRWSIDGRGMRLDSVVHYGTHFDNALWNGSQMIYGDGDGHIFNRFTSSLDVTGHELTHGLIQYTAALGYSGQTGALNEHLADAFGSMLRQYTLGQTAEEADWYIGAELFGPAVNAKGVRSMAAPGTAYDDPLLGRDPQPSHMRDYVETAEDNGGVHLNSGILNRAFSRASIEIGGNTWEVPGRVWYAALIGRLEPDADFHDFARATVDIAGELFGNGGRVQRIVKDAWDGVGLPVPLFGHAHRPVREHFIPLAARGTGTKWRQRPLR